MKCATNPRARSGFALATLSLLVLGSSGGCGGEANRPANASPIVAPESDAGKKALDDSKQLLKLRAEQEAKARKRSRGLPKDG